MRASDVLARVRAKSPMCALGDDDAVAMAVIDGVCATRARAAPMDVVVSINAHGTPHATWTESARLRNIDRTTLKRRWSSGRRVQNLRRRPLHLRVGVQDVKGLADFVRIDDDFQTRPLQHGVKRRRGRNVVDEINVNHRCGRHHVLQIVFSHDKNNKLRAFAKARNRARRSAAVSDIQAPKGAQKRNARQRRLRLQHRSARHGHRRCAIVHGIIRHAGF